MQVRCTEGLANHSGPESCAGIREGVSEALTGERAGQPWSCERLKSRVPTRFETWKATRTGALSRAPGRPGVVEDPGMRGSSLKKCAFHTMQDIHAYAVEEEAKRRN